MPKPAPQSLTQGLVDYGIPYLGPTIDTTYFPNTQSWWFWTASSNADDSSYAWFVFFSYGFVHYGSRYDDNAVRLVRTGQ